MLVYELIALLQDMDENAEVRLAQQPSWPFEYGISDVVCPDLPEVMTREEFDALDEDAQEQVMARADADELILLDPGQEPPAPVVYIGEGSPLAYLPGSVSRALGWR